MKASICIATYNKAKALRNTLKSIFEQKPSFDYEVIVVNDGSTDETKKVCSEFDIRYYRIDRSPRYRNPGFARNIAYKESRGEILVVQSDDVMHAQENTIEELINQLRLGTFVIGTVYNTDEEGRLVRDNYGLTQYTGVNKKRPLFFLGSLWRADCFAVGGNDEDFVYPGREDFWFAKCLTLGLGLTPIYSDTIIGHHQHHSRSQLLAYEFEQSKRIYAEKELCAEYKAATSCLYQ